ncbi:DUF1549 domain-containing protein [uncultured Paludibaculum sp.]|uniref:DUF1549 domain-containing protein n=1 Tax=uncultured Paludibaculum sp. TaxID=1765020 RepID=UPI002AAAB752|nr:DUF1549 domain-containing protein [uncultured Paludibaculum sp.]
MLNIHAAAITASAFAALTLLPANSVAQGVPEEGTPSTPISCIAFTPDYRERQAQLIRENTHFERGRLTQQVTAQLGGAEAARSVTRAADSTPVGTIDTYLFDAMQQAGVTPAAAADDYEFVRRVYLDLTGRIPTTDQLRAFVNDANPNKRRGVIDELIASDAWLDKWTMYFGDLLKNTVRNTQVVRYPEGRNALYLYIRESLATQKPYNVMASELISAKGDNSYTQGELNWVVGTYVTGGPVQDIYDSSAAATFETFLGVSHLNCLLCHNGAGHLTELSLWGKTFTRKQAWTLASHFSRTTLARTRVDASVSQPYYWSVLDNLPRIRNDYTANTTTGNRPARCKDNIRPAPGAACDATEVIHPQYLDGEAPASGDNYREFLARKVTSDIQFSRAIVNYLWAEFFTRGIVSPTNQFDLARLDPDNPPPAPWTLQPSNARLLNALAAEFQQNKYDLRWLMRQMANSRAYQLSARYEGEWKAEWEPLFARKLVRRLWGEEIHDSVVTASNIYPTYNVRNFATVRLAMQLPEPSGLPDGATGPVSRFLDSFFRGNRDDVQRKGEGSVQQALNLMNDSIVNSRIRVNTKAGLGGAEPSLLAANLGKDNDALIDSLFLAVLSRPASQAEHAAALEHLQGTTGTVRQQRAEDLLWTLFNKVDFLYNY